MTILIDTSTHSAYGIKYYKNGKYYKTFAKKEIILSAGSVGTPQLLMLSGIGPKNHLNQLKIPLIKDLPVGFNLHDHSGYGVTFLTDKPVTFRGDRYANSIANMTYEFNQTGPLSSPLPEALGFIYSKFSKIMERHPDLQVTLLPTTLTSDRDSARLIQHYSDELYNTRYLPIEGKEAFTIILALIHAKSVGTISLQSKNPFDQPVIDTNYFGEEDDI
ncbi:Versicolorin B synthase [Armadillidium nasatum]|uniref:Versicolorin B synthase n=1 Tax=Armadillidium nasatum TaxID=96803 RepID=A0A5N5SQ52_9CRUS|nr:Versicolorin B synthase [Armadillidium nasatum]